MPPCHKTANQVRPWPPQAASWFGTRVSVGRTNYLFYKMLQFQRICPTQACTKPPPTHSTALARPTRAARQPRSPRPRGGRARHTLHTLPLSACPCEKCERCVWALPGGGGETRYRSTDLGRRHAWTTHAGPHETGAAAGTGPGPYGFMFLSVISYYSVEKGLANEMKIKVLLNR